MRRLSSLLAAMAVGCGSTAPTPSGDTDEEISTDTDGDTEGGSSLVEVAIDDHQFECSETCSSWSMRNELTLRLRSEIDTTVTVEWTRTEIDGVPQATWSDPIDLAVVDLPGGEDVTVELSGRVNQCNPGISGSRTGRFFLSVDGFTFEFVAPSTFVSVPRPADC